MEQIVLENVRKTYRVSLRKPGLAGALRGVLRREWEEKHALDGISFSIKAGELVGYIGPNGAGKSTTVKIMGGILVPEEGRVEVMGRIPWKQRRAHVARIGVVFGQRSQLWWDTPVEDSFALLRDIYALPKAEYRARLRAYLELLDAERLLKTPVRQLSLGERMRCELIAALLHKPDILFLDEPTIGLDAVTKLALRDFLTTLNRDEGVTMILTTHDMDDIEALCRRVMVIGRGKLLFDGGLDGLRRRYAPWRVVRAATAGEPGQIQIPGAESITRRQGAVEVVFNPAALPAEKVIAQLAAQASITDLTVEAPDIERLVADMYKELSL